TALCLCHECHHPTVPTSSPWYRTFERFVDPGARHFAHRCAGANRWSMVRPLRRTLLHSAWFCSHGYFRWTRRLGSRADLLGAIRRALCPGCISDRICHRTFADLCFVAPRRAF